MLINYLKKQNKYLTSNQGKINVMKLFILVFSFFNTSCDEKGTGCLLCMYINSQLVLL